jgi:hypothetical protein
MFAGEAWEPARFRNYLIDVFEKTKGCSVEIIMKDISTVGREPKRLWETSEIAMDVAAKYR